MLRTVWTIIAVISFGSCMGTKKSADEEAVETLMKGVIPLLESRDYTTFLSRYNEPEGLKAVIQRDGLENVVNRVRKGIGETQYLEKLKGVQGKPVILLDGWEIAKNPTNVERAIVCIDSKESVTFIKKAGNWWIGKDLVEDEYNPMIKKLCG